MKITLAIWIMDYVVLMLQNGLKRNQLRAKNGPANKDKFMYSRLNSTILG